MREISFRSARENINDIDALPRWKVSPNHRSIARTDCRLAMNRWQNGVIFPAVTMAKRIDPASRFYAIGSCFAREIEAALSESGLDVASSALADGEPVADRPTFMNRYNVPSMLNDVAAAFDVAPFDERSIVQASEDGATWLDLDTFGRTHMRDQAILVRSRLHRILSRMRSSQTFILALGLNEAWFGRELSRYINVSPDVRAIFSRHPDRFVLRVLGYE